MEANLSIRLHAYATLAEARDPGRAEPYADALAACSAASAAVTASIICSHTRELRGDSPPGYVPRGQDELDFLIAGKASPKDAEDTQADASEAGQAEPKPQGARILPLRPGEGNLERLALGAAGVREIQESK